MSEWKECLIEKQAHLITKGTTPTSLGKSFIENGVNFIKAESITDSGEFVKEMFAFIDEDTHELLKRSQLQVGDILFTIAGVLGRIAIVNQEILPANTNQAVALIRLSTTAEIERLFLRYFLNSEFIINQIRRINVQAAQANFSLGDINRLHIIFPKDKSTQRKIAHILSTADAVIEKTQAAITKYKAIKQGMLHDLFTRGINTATGKLRPKQQDASELYKPSKLGWIPKEWEVERIDKIGNIITGSTPPTSKREYYGNEFLFVSPADIQEEIFISNTENKLTIAGFGICRQLIKYTICVVCIGSTIGKIALLEKEGCTNQQINSVICHDKELSFFCFYAMLYFNGNQFRKETGLQAVPIVNKNNFSKFKTPVVKKTEAIDISSRLKSIDNKIQTEQNYLHKLQQIKAGLMADLLSGKKEVVT